MFFAEGNLQAQTAIQASTTANVFARVFTAITSVKTSHKNTGYFSPGSFNGQLINSPEGILSLKGSIDKGGDINYSTSFDVSGNSNTAFAISMPKTPITLTNTSVAKTMTVSNWKSVEIPASGKGDLPAQHKTVNLDATLKLGTTNENPVGYYSGFYTITFGFN
jgi:hypothetical protein